MKSGSKLKCVLAAAFFFAAVRAALSEKAFPSKPPYMVTADFVFYNGSIYTLDPISSKANALAIKDGVVTFVGSNAHACPL